jgi:hypothetical protein
MTRVRARYLEVRYLEMPRLEMTLGCGLPSSFTQFTFPQARSRWYGPAGMGPRPARGSWPILARDCPRDAASRSLNAGLAPGVDSQVAGLGGRVGLACAIMGGY